MSADLCWRLKTGIVGVVVVNRCRCEGSCRNWHLLPLFGPGGLSQQNNTARANRNCILAFLKKKEGGGSQMAWISPNRIIYGSKSLYPSGKDRKASSPEEWLWKRNTMCSIVITFKICKSSSAYEKYLPAVIFTLSLLIKQRNPSYTVVSELFHVRRWRNFLNIFSLTVMHSQLEESEWVTSSELHHPLQHL